MYIESAAISFIPHPVDGACCVHNQWFPLFIHKKLRPFQVAYTEGVSRAKNQLLLHKERLIGYSPFNSIIRFHKGKTWCFSSNLSCKVLEYCIESVVLPVVPNIGIFAIGKGAILVTHIKDKKIGGSPENPRSG